MNNFRVLFMTLPRVIYDRSMHDRTTDFGEVAQYVVEKCEEFNVSVDIEDFAISTATLRYIYSYFNKKYDLVIIYTDVADVKLCYKIGLNLKTISPISKLFVYGDATLAIPQFFKGAPFDAFYLRGDQEEVVVSYIKYLLHITTLNELVGVCLCNDENKYIEREGEIRINQNDWAYPPLDKLPIDSYKIFSTKFRNSNYVCAFTVSKGCSKKCKYCLCSLREGDIERYRDVDDCISFICNNQNKFNKFKLHSPDIFSNKEWLNEFCYKLKKQQVKINWKATACFDNIDYETAKNSFEAGCYGIGFGVETFYKNSNQKFKVQLNKFKIKMNMLKEIPIRWKGYIMFNIPDQTYEDIQFTVDVLNEYNIVIRPAVYTPFYILKNLSRMDIMKMNIENWNKKEFYDYDFDKLDKRIWDMYSFCMVNRD